MSKWIILLLLVVAIVLSASSIGSGPAVRPAVLDVSQLASHSQEVEKGFFIAPLVRLATGEAAWGRFENVSIPMHYHGQSEIAYTLQGQVTMKFPDGSTSVVGSGQLIAFPPGAAAGLSGSGDFVFFATPPENEADTVWLEGPMAKPGAKADSTNKPAIIDVNQRIAQGLDQQGKGFSFTFAYKAKTGSVELFRIEKGVALHKHPKENHILYILKGRGRGQIGSRTAELGPGQIVVIPANVPHKLERIGDEPLDFILFSTLPFNPDDIVWLK